MNGRIFALIAVAALAVAGCEGDDGTNGAQGPAGFGFAPRPVADQPLGTFDEAGVAADQVLETLIDDGTGVWEITLDHQVQIDEKQSAAEGGANTVVIASAIFYDSNHDDLWITIDGVDHVLTDGASSFSTDAIFDGAENLPDQEEGTPFPFYGLDWDDDSSFDYVESANLEVQDDNLVDIQAYMVWGLKTGPLDMPNTGVFTYSGFSDLRTLYTADGGTCCVNNFQGGTVNMSVDFGAATEVTWDTTNGLLDAAFRHDLDGTATISGNSYSGTFTGSVIGSVFDAANTLVYTDGTLEGSFYGPAADVGVSESGGTFEATDSVGAGSATGTTVGMFVAQE